MRARRVYTADGSSYIDPPLPDDASALEKLTWKAEVASGDSGLDITVEDGGYYVSGVAQPGFYTVSIRYDSTSGPHTFSEAWTWMNGIVAGARAARKSL